jgi:SAM-dependent methyltransferase
VGLRFRDEALVLLQEYGRGAYLTLDELVADPVFRELSVYFVGERGPVRRRLESLPHYVESRFAPGVERGATLDHGVTMQDLQALTFDAESFDLIVSSHVMEHVPDPWQALSEVSRVLRPNGRYVFSVPYRFPALVDSVQRARISGGEIVHLHEPRYHDAPDGPSLVFWDFGADLVDRGEAVGLTVRIIRPHLPVQVAFRDVVVVADSAGTPRSTVPNRLGVTKRE